MAKLNRSDREAFGVGGFVFGLLALLLAFAALVTAARATSRSDDAIARIHELAAGGIVAGSTDVTLQEFSIVAHPGLVEAGTVTLHVNNTGSITHELVIVRAASAAALPLVKKAGERAVGAIDEEAIAETDKMGETGDIPAGATVTKTFDLPPGTYVMFCNIDSKAGSAVLNHFTKGMVAPLIAV